MKLHTILIDQVTIPDNRQRKEMDPNEVVNLATSISENGLLQPPVVRKGADGTFILIAGERRIKAMHYLWNLGEKVICGEASFAENQLPCLYLGEIDPTDAFEMELEENIRRVDLSWQERASATAQLFELRKKRAAEENRVMPTVTEISNEVRGSAAGKYREQTRREIIVAAHLEDIEVQRSKNADEAFKVLKKREERSKNEALGESLKKSLSAANHRLIKGDCLSEMEQLPKESFDIILTDPPYGINAQDFNDSGGRTGSHTYDDSLENWCSLMEKWCCKAYEIAKPLAHAYVFCDIDNFVRLKMMMDFSGWDVFRTPIVWVNPTAMRAPWPENGPQRKWQLCLYAMKGKRPVNKLVGDVVTIPSDVNLGWAAQKPVDLYKDLLLRSARPGDTVLDPFCGSGTIFPAAHAVQCMATGIEIDNGAVGIAAGRLEALK